MPRLARAWPLAAVLAGCQPSPSPQAGPVPASATLPSSAAPAEASPPTDALLRYACDAGHRVELVRGETARVTLSDGRVIDIPRVPGSMPPRYGGEALSFEAGRDGAVLGQHETGGFACHESG